MHYGLTMEFAAFCVFESFKQVGIAAFLRKLRARLRMENALEVAG